MEETFIYGDLILLNSTLVFVLLNLWVLVIENYNGFTPKDHPAMGIWLLTSKAWCVNNQEI